MTEGLLDEGRPSDLSPAVGLETSGPTVSVIVPVYQAEQTLERCIDGLLRQTLSRSDYEVVLVDNNSTDRSVQIAADHPEVTLVKETKQGAYAARNRALPSVSGRIIAFTDPDCVPDADWLTRILEVMDSADVQVVVGSSRPAGDPNRTGLLETWERARDEYIFSSDSEAIYYGRTNNMAVRRELFSDLGLFLEEPRGSDTAFVQAVVWKHSVRSVEYSAAVRVLHLEIDGLWRFIYKMYVYGRSHTSHRALRQMRQLTLRERITILRRAAAATDRPRRSLFLLSVTAILTAASWNLGRAHSFGRRLLLKSRKPAGAFRRSAARQS